MALLWAAAPPPTTTISNPNLTTSWQRYVFRVAMTSNLPATNVLYISIVEFSAVKGTLDIDHVQVEQADTPSAWKPFPSELEPGSVTADKISVTSVWPPSKWTPAR